MNEITRIHIAKVAYDIEISAKKELEKYIHSLERYANDPDVLADVEIRITELLSERGVRAGGVISAADIAAVRAQLGEPYEFSDGEGDIAIGPSGDANSRRYFRATDTAVVGGVLSGLAAYLNVNPLWTRLLIILLSFLSFGTTIVVYIVLWAVIPPAKTAADKLRMAGKEVTVESIKALNAQEERETPNKVAPLLQHILLVGMGIMSALIALGIFAGVIWAIAAALWGAPLLYSFIGLDTGYTWLAWVLFWVTMFGLLLLGVLFGIIAYGFFAKKINKSMVVSGVVIIVLGIASAAAVIGVASSQAIRIQSETQSMVETSNAELGASFSKTTALNVVVKRIGANGQTGAMYTPPLTVRYIVDSGMPRYELRALNTTRFTMTTQDTRATATIEIADSFRNMYMQPELTIYGPALNHLSGTIPSNILTIDYAGTQQAALELSSSEHTTLTARGSYDTVTLTGTGQTDVSSASINSLVVNSTQPLMVTAGVVRELTVTQPDVCPVDAFNPGASISVVDVSSGAIMYNGKTIPAKTYRTACGAVEFRNGMYPTGYTE